ncbi:hypothetical protein MLD38_025737 [Melastoma candidum]|uniref:Uncharacterized protein n=1 Tax=Melastoma candidum TaxID=119954 RepID=A0ACB9NX92_9MYRT|nr:hypothetical protein MLD38_025737 [Melastoma candidum]
MIMDLGPDVVLYLVPVWISFAVGVVIGWLWKPEWAYPAARGEKVVCSVEKPVDSSLPPKPETLASPVKVFGADSRLNSFILRWPNMSYRCLDEDVGKRPESTVPDDSFEECSGTPTQDLSNLLTEGDLKELWLLVEEKDGGPEWMHIMDRYTLTMSYQAWRRDPKMGPPQYRSRTVFEDASPELVRDFFWDDEFRPKWDEMLSYSATVQECPTTGTMVVHWIRKFPFFCSDRDYIIGRRIWECGRSYFCVTKGVPCPTIPKRDGPRRVDLYYSGWCIRSVESGKTPGQMTACEVILFHYEDMGIPNEIAKLGVRQGMWGAVKKIEPGLRTYQKLRLSGQPLSRPAVMAKINTKVHSEFLHLLEAEGNCSTEMESSSAVQEKPEDGIRIPKALLVSGIVILVFSLDRGLLAKAVFFGVARRFSKARKRDITISKVDSSGA